MNTEFLLFIVFSLFYIIVQDKVAVLEKLSRFGNYYQTAWQWIRDGMARIIRDEEDWEGAWSTHTLIMLNLAAFVYAMTLGYETILRDFAFIPALSAEAWRWITHQFLHAPQPVELAPFSLHLLGNMLYLYVFGDNVEKWLQRFKYERLGTQLNIYAGLYLIFGVVAAASQATATGWNTYILMVGASGAISGILGMYLILFPHNTVYVAGKETMPAYIYLLLWFVSQFALTDPTIAVYAHVGGFAAGSLTALALKKVYRVTADEEKD